jgi:hypothetical protein
MVQAHVARSPARVALCVKIIVHPSCFCAQNRGLAVLARVSDAHGENGWPGEKVSRLPLTFFF